jgi:hypothetical protein
LAVARDAIAKGVGILCFQPGTHTDEAARLAADAGLTVVTGRCMGALHAQLGLGPGPSTQTGRPGYQPRAVIGHPAEADTAFRTQ